MCGLLRAGLPWRLPADGLPCPQTQEKAAAAEAGPEQGARTSESLLNICYTEENLSKKVNHNDL